MVSGLCLGGRDLTENQIEFSIHIERAAENALKYVQSIEDNRLRNGLALADGQLPVHILNHLHCSLR
jgi:hypothetical protein